jgi:hypothetical protein
MNPKARTATPPADALTAALESDSPGVALGDAVRRLLDGGMTPKQLVDVLTEIWEQRKSAGRDYDADLVSGMLDVLNGWGPPAVLKHYGLEARSHVEPRRAEG